MDVVIPISERDINTILKVSDYFFDNLETNKIVIIGKESLKNNFKDTKKYHFIDEDSLYQGLSYDNIKNIIKKINSNAIRRTGWYLQQFLKMAYAYCCQDDCYLVWDSDTIPLKKITFKNNKNQYLYSLKNEFYEPYFASMNTLIPKMSKRNTQGSYITEHMIFDVNIMKTLIKDMEDNDDIEGSFFYEKILNSIKPEVLSLSGFSEFETYGTYVFNFYNNEYSYRLLKPMRYGRIYFGNTLPEKYFTWVSKSYDTISFEHFDRKWILIGILLPLLSKRFSMAEVDNVVGPIIDLSHKVRRIIKELVKR